MQWAKEPDVIEKECLECFFSVTWLTEESLDLPNEQTETGHADDR